jgi:uncharacterized OB-fold protein
MEKDKKETRVINSTLDMNLLKWRIEADGLALLTQGYKDKKVLGRKCHQCGTVYVPGLSFCRKCFIDIQEVVEVSKKGKIVSFAVNLADIRGNPLEKPIVAVDVKLEGSDSWMSGKLEIEDWKKVFVGMPVELYFQEETQGKLADIDCFKPI